MNIFIWGDSNTWGYIPTLDLYDGIDSHTKRYKENEMWWHILSKDNKLFINGNNGRTINNNHPLYNGKNSMTTILNNIPNEKIDLTIIMLGTNDLKECYALSINNLIDNMDRLVNVIKEQLNCNFLLICPPLIYDTVVTNLNYKNGIQKIKEYNEKLKSYANKKGFMFASAISCEVGIDGEHLTKEGHKDLGLIVNKLIK